MAMATSHLQRKHLTLKEKVEVVQLAQESPKMSLRELAEKFSCGKTQISGILKDKDNILSLYEANRSSSLQLTRKRSRTSEYADVNDALYLWYQMACSKNIYPMGPQLSEKAKEIAMRFGKEDFKASAGWLDKWKKRHNIKKMAVVGESGDVNNDTASSWKERLPVIVAGYKKEDIYNLDETGCFWRALPDHGFGQHGKRCQGGKQSKERFTVALIVNAAGEKERPIVIWKSENPRCFKGIDKDSLPVTYFSQKKAWMTSDIFDSVLTTWNCRLITKGRSILLLIDNAGCHPRHLQEKFSNIKVVYLPPNTTSVLQPLDLGIIQTAKLAYRKYFMRFVLAKIEECTNATDVAKSVNVLLAIRWISKAWCEVKKETIEKCFRKAGILDDKLDPVNCDDDGIDPFEDADAQLQDLIAQAMPTDDTCSVQEYVNGENCPTCPEYEDPQSLDEEFWSAVAPGNSDDDSDDDEDESSSPPPKLKNTQEAIQSLEDVKTFLEARGLMQESTKVHSLIDTLAFVNWPGKQSDIRDYFM